MGAVPVVEEALEEVAAAVAEEVAAEVADEIMEEVAGDNLQEFASDVFGTEEELVTAEVALPEEVPEELPEEVPEEILPEIMESEELDFESGELLEKEEEHLEVEIISPPEVEV